MGPDVVDSADFVPECVVDDVGDPHFRRTARRIRRRGGRDVRDLLRQALSVHFAAFVAFDRECARDVPRNHPRGELVLNARSDVGTVPCVADEERIEVGFAVGRAGHDCHVPDTVDSADGCFHLGGLDEVSADLDGVVGSAEQVQVPELVESAEIAGCVAHERPVAGEV